MIRRVVLHIDAGEATCASSPGAFCPHMRSSMRGQFTCALFGGRELRDQHGRLSGEGWLQRLPECVAAEADGGR